MNQANHSTTSAATYSDRPGYRYYVLFALLVVYALNFLDRQFLTILAEPVRKELGLTDTELGLLTGLTFAVFYSVFGIPVAILSDRTRRIRVVAAACAIWSLFSAGCGLATGFTSLAIARIGVGMGEAGGSPPSHSMISDYFPAHQRGTALAIYALGVPLGTMFGAASGGWIAAHYGWRTAFYALGILGLIVAPILLLTVREPKRGRFDGAVGESTGTPSAVDTIKMFFKNPALLSTSIAAGLTAFIGFAMLNWAPSFLIREKGMTLQSIAMFYSLTLGASMGLGTYASGYLVDRFGPRFPRSYAVAPGVAILLTAPFLIGFVYAPTWTVALVVLMLPSALNMAYLAPALAVVQNTVPSNQRAAASAIFLLVVNVIGLGGGPVFVGWMSDHFKNADFPHPLQPALLGLVPFCILAFLAQLVASRYIGKPGSDVAPSR